VAQAAFSPHFFGSKKNIHAPKASQMLLKWGTFPDKKLQI
jgi:hypothetical protein